LYNQAIHQAFSTREVENYHPPTLYHQYRGYMLPQWATSAWIPIYMIEIVRVVEI
jgi:hypothetical protein